MKHLLKKSLSATLPHLPVSWLIRMAPGPLFPYYHLVSDVPPVYMQGSYPVASVQVFERNLDFLLRHWKPVSLEDILGWVREGAPVPQGVFHLTFDDGFREVYDVVFPVLKRKGIPATTFVCSDLLEPGIWMWEHERALVVRAAKEADKQILQSLSVALNCISGYELQTLSAVDYEHRGALSRAADCLHLDLSTLAREHSPYLAEGHIREMIASGFTFGSHALDHPLFQNLTLEHQLAQISQSVRAICERFGLPYKVFAFPYGESGLSPELFSRIFGEGLVDICWGTRGMLPDEYPGVIQRLWMEVPGGAVSCAIRQELTRKVIRKLVHNDKVTRK